MTLAPHLPWFCPRPLGWQRWLGLLLILLGLPVVSRGGHLPGRSGEHSSSSTCSAANRCKLQPSDQLGRQLPAPAMEHSLAADTGHPSNTTRSTAGPSARPNGQPPSSAAHAPSQPSFWAKLGGWLKRAFVPPWLRSAVAGQLEEDPAWKLGKIAIVIALGIGLVFLGNSLDSGTSENFIFAFLAPVGVAIAAIGLLVMGVVGYSIWKAAQERKEKEEQQKEKEKPKEKEKEKEKEKPETLKEKIKEQLEEERRQEYEQKNKGKQNNGNQNNPKKNKQQPSNPTQQPGNPPNQDAPENERPRQPNRTEPEPGD